MLIGFYCSLYLDKHFFMIGLYWEKFTYMYDNGVFFPEFMFTIFDNNVDTSR